jgi:hypothetical protein
MNVVEVEAEMKGKTPGEWETTMMSDVDVIIIDGCWLLPARRSR